MAVRPLSLQDHFLNSVRRSRLPVTIFLAKGVKLQGVITSFDAFSLLLRRDDTSQLVYKHAIFTIVPSAAVPQLTLTSDAGRGQLQDKFLDAARQESARMTLFLVNGVMLQGTVTGFDQFSLVLERSEQVQLVYKHAISTLQPEHALKLNGPEGLGEEEPAN